MQRLSASALPLDGLMRVERQRLGDARGFLARLFCADTLKAAGWTLPVSQVNHTYTARRATVRGLHYQQAPHAEMKLVSCLRGQVWDVAVDLRPASPTYLQWHAELLSADNGHALLIPEGFAHGFQTLSDEVEMLYLHSAAYHPESEKGVHPQDATLAIAWPLAIGEMSARDQSHPAFDPTLTAS